MSILNIAMGLEHSARKAPNKTYLQAGEERLTYARVETEARRFANVLTRLGVRKGDKVALLVPNTPDFVICYFGALKAGAAAVPLDVTAPGDEVAYFLSNSEASVLVAVKDNAEAAAAGFKEADSCRTLIMAGPSEPGTLPKDAVTLAELMSKVGNDFDTVPTGPEDMAVLLYTSGTMGRPKGAILTHANYSTVPQFLAREFWELSAEDVVLMVAPAAHVFGQALINASCAVQATLSMIPRFDPERFLGTIERHNVTFIAGVPTLAHFMLNSPLVKTFNLSSLRRAMIAGSPLPAEMAEGFAKRFNLEIVTGFGMTESTYVTYLNAAMFRQAPPGSVGRPGFGTTVAVLDEKGRYLAAGETGELVMRGPQLAAGYYRRPEETAESWRDGWFHTGDAGYMDGQGYVFLVDRLKEIIKRSGYSVAPAEVERTLLSHPAVSEAVVIGVPDEALGEEVKAFVVLRPGSVASGSELIEHCKSRLAAYKYPRLVEFRDSLPKGRTGKIIRRVLREEGGHVAP
jgi:long-chain acyl-CoA synthetase